MDKEVKARWVEALRSGRYKQGKQRLREDGGDEGFCCLGVLCDVKDPKGWDTGRYEGMVGFLPDSVMLWAGLLSASAAWNQNDDAGGEGYDVLVAGLTPGEQSRLSKLNDEGQTFAEIADRIERCL